MNNQNFETAYAELEQIVQAMEDGGASLDDTIALYERGVALAQHCSQLLEKAELRVKQLRDESDGSYSELPF